jgi:hypothetical protein
MISGFNTDTTTNNKRFGFSQLANHRKNQKNNSLSGIAGTASHEKYSNSSLVVLSSI